jgi:hypothetical protein
MKATKGNGALEKVPDCYVVINNVQIDMYALPEISDSRSVAYNDEPIMGRSLPMKTFSHGENRTISMEIPFYITEEADPSQNLAWLRAIESACWPQEGKDTPYVPPRPCSIKCGKQLGDDPVCCVLKSYSVRFQSDVAWDEETLLPYKFTVSCQFEAIYAADELPNEDKILESGS